MKHLIYKHFLSYFWLIFSFDFWFSLKNPVNPMTIIHNEMILLIQAAKIGIFSEYAILFLQKIIRKNGYAAIKTKISASFCLPLPSKHTSL